MEVSVWNGDCAAMTSNGETTRLHAGCRLLFFWDGAEEMLLVRPRNSATSTSTVACKDSTDRRKIYIHKFSLSLNLENDTLALTLNSRNIHPHKS